MIDPEQAYRLLQCLVVSIRPLRVDELAEVLALDFDVANDGIPVLDEGRRWDDKEQGVLATCSSLIVVVEDYVNYWEKTRVVRFAHFSVKEFLTSDRLADLKADISRFHIRLEPAHTVIAQACLAILLQSYHDDMTKSTSPLSKYAAQHWVSHAQFENVSSRIEEGMRRLFNPEKPYFNTWLNSYNIDNEWTFFLLNRFHRRNYPYPQPKIASLGKDDAPLCLYYAALCGFRDLTEHFITIYPQHVNASVGLTKSPLVAALYHRHLRVAQLLHQHGAILTDGDGSRTLLHSASADGLVDIVQWLLRIGADANEQGDGHRTPLHLAAANGHLKLVRILLGHSADANSAAATKNPTPLHEASGGGHIDIVRILIEQGADVHAQDRRQWTPLHYARNAETAQLLIKHGADIHACESQSTPMHHARNIETVRLLIEHGADVHARDGNQSTPLHLASSRGDAEIVQLLLRHEADVYARDKTQSTPLHLASSRGEAETVQLFPEHMTDAHVWFPPALYLICALSKRHYETAQHLISYGADVHARDQCQSTPLHLASSKGNAQTVKLLIDNGANVRARDQSQSTPLHFALFGGNEETVPPLIEHGADVNARNQDQSTPLHLASLWTTYMSTKDTIRLLIKHGANANTYDKNHQTPLHLISSYWLPNADSLQLLLENGADVDAVNDEGLTPISIATTMSRLTWTGRHDKIVQLLRDHRARIVSTTL